MGRPPNTTDPEKIITMRAAPDSGESSEPERENEAKRQRTEQVTEITEFIAIPQGNIAGDNTTDRESTCAVRNFTTTEAVDTVEKFKHWISKRMTGEGVKVEAAYSKSSWDEVNFRVTISQMLDTHHASKVRTSVGIKQSPSELLTQGPNAAFLVRDYLHSEAELNVDKLYNWLNQRSSPQMIVSPPFQPASRQEYLHRLSLMRVLRVANTTTTIPRLRTLVAETPERNRRPAGESPQGAQYAEDREGTDSRSDEATEASESEDDGPVEANVTVDGSPLGGEKRKGKKSE